NGVFPGDRQFDPSADIHAVTVDPARTSLSQVGGACTAPLIQFVAAPVAGRVMNSTSLLGRRSRIACAAFAASDSRIMIPAFANVFVFPMLDTRAMICPSPLSG